MIFLLIVVTFTGNEEHAAVCDFLAVLQYLEPLLEHPFYPWFGNSGAQRPAQFHWPINRSKYGTASVDGIQIKAKRIQTAR